MDIYDFVEMLKAKAIDHREYFHYTTLDKYYKMQQPVVLPDGETHRMLWLTRATDTNDGMERNYGAHEYLGCFTYSPYENVGMWFMYGKERPDAVRIGFDQRHFKTWRKANIWDEGKSRKARLYSVSSDSEGIPVYQEIPADQIVDVCFYDVAYVCTKEDVEHHRWPKSVEWRREYYEVRSDDPEFVSEKGSLLYSNDFTERICGKLPFCFKKKGWSSEREVRIVVSLKPEATVGKTIAIPFDAPLGCIAGDTKQNVVLSPWYKDELADKIINDRNASKSVFADELLIKSKPHLISCPIPKVGGHKPLFVRIASWDDFYRIAAWFASKNRQWVFRGERDKKREVTTSFERKRKGIPLHCSNHDGRIDTDKFQEYLRDGVARQKELAIIQSFKSMMSWRYMGESWLPYVMAMQHYGGPTRLLDFTYSLFTALFFAYEHDDKSGERTIWTINLDLILQWAHENCKIFSTADCNGKSNFSSVAESVFNELTTGKECVFSDMAGVIPVLSANNPRMLAQKGLFLMPMKSACFLDNLSSVLPCAKYAKAAYYKSIPRVSAEAFLASEEASNIGLMRFEFDDDLRKTAKEILAQANVDRTNLFPDTKENAQMFDRISSELGRILKKGLY